MIVATTHLARNPEDKRMAWARGYQYASIFKCLQEFATEHDHGTGRYRRKTQGTGLHRLARNQDEQTEPRKGRFSVVFPVSPSKMPFCFGNQKGSLKSGGGGNRTPVRERSTKSLYTLSS